MTDAPAPMIEPRPRIGGALRLEAVKIGDRPLQPDARAMASPDRGEAAVRTITAQHRDLVAVEERHVHHARLAPETKERALAVGERAYRRAPALVRHEHARP